ncbi:purine/pyrimidine permease [Bradyrhizobium sp. 182]|uniref:uracil-xanthine permease family protein n=1 Tax=unclassified Bradyrhizobium TaxID=2631580 RepID=UPI001FF937E6|nr:MULTISPECIES: solute carrier family 23 protein [unclassified Bradyrhizobium]MCK1419625.1 purine/pyrimidine permease [Bradyrhizobium sp. CW12]MCK1527586.1 purine/pyrimidine permease [Bradyrhizobium sp. 182]MCK1648229.1 purine/pyrimidine permease [Bradyrhizobium sp. 154]
MTRPPGLIYAVDDHPPWAILIVSALQHIGLMAITLIFPIIIAREANLSGTQFLDLVSLSMFGLGAATICLCIRSRYIGSGYLCGAAYTAIFLGPSLFALRQGGLALVFGMTVIGGFVQVALAPLLHRLRALLPSEIAGLVIAVVGLTLATLGVRYGLGINAQQPNINPDYMIVAGVSLVTMTVLNIWSKGYGKMFCVLIGMMVGYAVSAGIGIFDLARIVPEGGLSIVRLPRFQHVGWSYDPVLVGPFMIASLAATLRAMGDVSNAQRINDADWVRPNFGSLAGGVSANGVAVIFCGLVGSCGINTYSSSIGLSGATGVTSRSVGYAIGFGFCVLAFVPPVAVVLAAMPLPVMGAALFFTAAFVFTSGLQMITARMLDARKTLVIGFSFAMAVVADLYHEALTEVPIVLQPIFGNALVLGTVSAVVLNLIMRIGVRQQVSIKLAPGGINREAVERFLSEQGARWAARRDIMQRAIFGVVQVLEVIGDPPGGIEVEASFDEFNLDVRIRYVGAPLTIPERKPTRTEIVASEHGERLLAGYLLRQSADSISAQGADGSVEMILHYDH